MSNQPTGRSRSFCFAGGGTGGHLTPGLSVARGLLSRFPEADILFIGSDRLLERQLIEAAGFTRHVLPAEPLPTLRRRPWRFVWRNWRAYCQARALLKQLAPAVVVGLGGFASVPAVLAASRLGIPVVMLEQNTIPGRATRWLAKSAAAVCISFAITAEKLPHGANSKHTGNPVHVDIAKLYAASHVDHRPSLLILGGSQGASAVNRAVMVATESLADRLGEWTVVHQTGIDDWHEIEHHYQRLGLEHVTAPFFSDMPLRYQAAELVVSRAGATTLAELACAGCPTIAIPYPWAADNHQQINAEFYESTGAARIVKQDPASDQTPALLTNQLADLLDDLPKRQKMRAAMHALAQPRATEDVIEVILNSIED